MSMTGGGKSSGGNLAQAGAANSATAGLAQSPNQMGTQAGPLTSPQTLSASGQATNGLNASFAAPNFGAMDTAAPPSASVDQSAGSSFWDEFNAIMEEGGAEAFAEAGAAVGGALEDKVSHVGGISPYRGNVGPLENPGLLNLSNIAAAMRSL